MGASLEGPVLLPPALDGASLCRCSEHVAAASVAVRHDRFRALPEHPFAAD